MDRVGWYGWMVAVAIGCGPRIDRNVDGEDADGSAGDDGTTEAASTTAADPVVCPTQEPDQTDPCTLDASIPSCIYADPDCPGATLVFTCADDGRWDLEIEWDIPNCNSPETCPEEPQQLGGECNVKSWVTCTYDDPTAGCPTVAVDLQCTDGVWQTTQDC